MKDPSITPLPLPRYNAHQVDHSSREGVQVSLTGVGSGLYPVLGLINHSCDANTVRININNTVILVATR